MAKKHEVVALDQTKSQDEVIEGAPPAPVPTGGPPADWPHRDLYERVKQALYALPVRFKTKLTIAGISATDLFTLNTPLGSAIEVNVVEALNELRSLWDPSNGYSDYSFVRHAQAFPDVRFQKGSADGPDPILFGIELKGWFLLGKEGEPSFRYKISANACAPADLLVVFPWILDEVTSGTPKLLKPFIAEAKHAAEHRNYYWTYGRGGSADTGSRLIKLSAHAAPYPNKADKANDEPVKDSGNFGRVARGGFMTEFAQDLLEEPIAGIPAKYWQSFLKIFAEGAQPKSVQAKLEVLRKQAVNSGWGRDKSTKVEAFLDHLSMLLTQLS